jgi:hypothetical protein
MYFKKFFTIYYKRLYYLYMENENLTPPVNNGEKTRRRKFDPERM